MIDTQMKALSGCTIVVCDICREPYQKSNLRTRTECHGCEDTGVRLAMDWAHTALCSYIKPPEIDLTGKLYDRPSKLIYNDSMPGYKWVTKPGRRGRLTNAAWYITHVIAGFTSNSIARVEDMDGGSIRAGIHIMEDLCDNHKINQMFVSLENQYKVDHNE